MSINWDTYKPDITRLYVNGNKTAEETIEYLNEKHGAGITIRKFKSEFGSLKKLQAKEWRAIFQEIRKRKADGKDSDVYLCGRRLNQSRVDRAKRRYDKGPNLRRSASTFDQSRIEIRSPAAQNSETSIEASSSAVRASTEHHRNQESVGTGIRPTTARNAELVAVRLSRDTTTAREADEATLPQVSADGRYIDNMDLHEICYDYSTPTLDKDFSNDFTGNFHDDMNDMVGMSDQNLVPFLSQGKIPTLDTISSIFEANQPGSSYHRQSLSPFINFSFRIPSQIPTGIPSCSRPLIQSFWNSKVIYNIFPELRDTGTLPRISNHHSAASVPFGNAGWILSCLAGVSPALRVLQPAASVVEYIVSNSTTNGRSKTEVPSSMNLGQKSIYQVFTVVAYLVSNNCLNIFAVNDFMSWVVSSGYLGQLSTFLKDYSSKLREARVFIVEVLQASFSTEVGLPRRKENLFKTHPDESFKLLLALDGKILMGSLGNDLLVSAVTSDHLAAVKILVGQGVDVNGINHKFDRYHLGEWTPLSWAALHGSLELVRFLIKSGAKVNTQFHGINTIGTALAIAVRNRRAEIVSALLTEVATISLHPKTLQLAKVDAPDIYQLLLDKLEADEVETLLLVEAAESGPENLSQFLLARNIVEDEVLERGLHHAVVGCNVRASRTLLRRGVDPYIPKYRMVTQSAKHTAKAGDRRGAESSDSESGDDISDDESNNNDRFFEDELSGLRFHESSLVLLAAKGATEEDERMKYILYLLVKAGARLKMKTIKRIQDEVPEEVDCDLYTILFSAGQDVSSIGLEMLVDAASEGNFYMCNALLNRGVPINAYGEQGLSSLQAAAAVKEAEPVGEARRTNKLILVQYLLDRGANVNLAAHHDGGRTALQAAVSKGYSDVIDCLLDAGADVTAPAAKEWGLTVLEATAPFTYSANIEGVDNNRPLIFKKLLALGAPVNRPNDAPGQVLHGLVRYSRFECLKLALRAGARIEDRYENQSLFFELRPLTLTPLQLAAHRLNEKAIQLLLEHGADVNALATDGHTALQCALLPEKMLHQNFKSELQVEIVQLLLDNKANVNAPASPNFGRTALQAAASHEYSSPYLVDLLLQRDAAVNAEPAMRGGITAIQGAAISGSLQIARMLLDHGANINAPAAPEEGRTAIEGAAEHGRLEMVRLLLRSGALPDPVTGFSTAITFAKAQNHWGVADILEESQNAFDPFSLSFCDPLTWASDHVGQDLEMGFIDNEPPIF